MVLAMGKGKVCNDLWKTIVITSLGSWSSTEAKPIVAVFYVIHYFFLSSLSLLDDMNNTNGAYYYRW